jgi:hypothetical protein
MTGRAFIVMQIGAKGSPERSRADEVYNFIVKPAVVDAGLEAYRADLDFSPGPITPKFLSELLNARLIIADLTGRNPNVFYELGIAHSFARPLISIADSAISLPFDTKDERIIELGEYLSTGLTYTQGEQAKASLKESLKIVLTDNYVPPSPLRDLAANASVDRLAPENPLAAEMAHVRESLDEIRRIAFTIREGRDEILERISDQVQRLREEFAMGMNSTPRRSSLSSFSTRSHLSDLLTSQLMRRNIRFDNIYQESDYEYVVEIHDFESTDATSRAFRNIATDLGITISVDGATDGRKTYRSQNIQR